MKIPSFKTNFLRMRKIAFRSLMVVLGLSVVSLLIYTNANFSTGTRVGTVVKISKKGVFFKTWEGQLNTGAITERNENGYPSTIWEFSVPNSNKDVLEDLDRATEIGKRVKLHYHQKYVTLPWRGDTEYLIYKVEILQ